jgi:hypothetical protein
MWKKGIPDEVCDQVIEIFEDVVQKNPHIVTDRKLYNKSTNMQRDDIAISLNDSPVVTDKIYPNKKQICNLIYDQIWKCYKQYITEYGQLTHHGHYSSSLKVQKTMPYGGFHTWHYEQDGPGNSIRELVWTVYLNTMPPNEAETEFLYQAVKIQPQRGAICIFPAAMTHVHRGLTVYTQPKYIITGWFLRTDKEPIHVNSKQLSFNF